MPEAEAHAPDRAALNEFIETEKSYVKRLMTAYKIYWLGSQALLSEPEHTKIFSNLDEIVLANDNFLQDLVDWENCKYAGKSIADIFLNHISKFSVYSLYCRGQQAAVQFLQEKLQEPAFAAFLRECTGLPECNGLDLGSFLLEPVQRIARYPLLLRHIQKFTQPDSEENSVLALAIAESQDLLNRLNAAMAEAENEVKVLSIQRRLSQARPLSHSRAALSFDAMDLLPSGWKHKLDPALLPADFSGLTRALGARQLLKSGLWVKLKSRRKFLVFLFSDFLLFAEVAGGPTVLAALQDDTSRLKLYRNPLPLDEIWMLKEAPPAQCPSSVSDAADYRILELEAHNCERLLAHVPAAEFDDWCAAIEHAKGALRHKTPSTRSPPGNQASYLSLEILSAEGLSHASESASYCKVGIEGAERACETEKAPGASPAWNKAFVLELPAHPCTLKIELITGLNPGQPVADFIISSDFFGDSKNNEIIPIQPTHSQCPSITLLIRMRLSRRGK